MAKSWKEKVRSANKRARDKLAEANTKFAGYSLLAAGVAGYLDEGETEDQQILGRPRREIAAAVALGASLGGFAGKYATEAVAIGSGLAFKTAYDKGGEIARDQE